MPFYICDLCSIRAIAARGKALAAWRITILQWEIGDTLTLRSRGYNSSRDQEVYNQEIERLEQCGYVVKLAAEAVDQTPESWYIPHHMVHHNGKHRVVYNCSFKYQCHNLNNYLLPGPTLTSTLLGVLLHFREHAIAITSDIKGMFHQIRLLPEDKPLLRFLWRNMQRETPVSVYEWQVCRLGLHAVHAAQHLLYSNMSKRTLIQEKRHVWL